ncbi:MAG TPA: hypothetical protein PKA90_15685 [Ignavibacteria bacterium]|nr:hypothetical protein [Ignavibacteria bacterium]HMR41859.1 hypothetical protein [Ignavibacteria bacterium]
MKRSHSSQRSKVTEDPSEKLFGELKNENYDNTFPVAEQWLRGLSNNLSTKSTERKITIMKNYFAVNKFKLAYLSIFIIFIVGATTMPVTSHENVGDVIMWKADKSNSQSFLEIKNLDWFNNKDKNITSEISGGESKNNYVVMIPKEDHEKVESYINSLEKIEGVSDIKSVSINETVKRTLVSLVLNDIFKVNIDATNKSNQEVETEIKNQLSSAGINNVTVSFEMSPGGERQIKINIPEGSIPEDGGVEMTIKDGKRVNKFKEVKKNSPGGDDANFSKMTDAEVRNKVREDVGEPGLRDDQIQITRDGGKMTVKILGEDGSVKGKLEIEEERK